MGDRIESKKHLNPERELAFYIRRKSRDGNYNEYFYANGVCSKIEIHHSLYSASIELTS